MTAVVCRINGKRRKNKKYGKNCKENKKWKYVDIYVLCIYPYLFKLSSQNLYSPSFCFSIAFPCYHLLRCGVGQHAFLLLKVAQYATTNVLFLFFIFFVILFLLRNEKRTCLSPLLAGNNLELESRTPKHPP